jgi:broad specificity phosphatase PhoE
MKNIEQGAERHEKFGKNVELRATFMRHGPKADASDVTGKSLLSEAGREDVKEAGQRLDAKSGGIKSYTSPVERAIETADLVIKEQEKKGAKIFEQRKRTELSLVPDSKEFYEEFEDRTKQNLPDNYDQLRGEEKQEAFEEAEDKVLNWYLEFGDQKPDEKTASPHEIAAGVAKLVHRYVRMPEKLHSGSKVDLLNTSHKGTLEPFLKKTLIRKTTDEAGKETTVRGFDEIEEIGGGMRPSESWELDVTTDENGEKTVKLNLRGKTYDLDLDRVEELSASTKQ